MMIQQRAARPELDFLCTLIKETQDDFEKFSEFIDRVAQLQTPRLASCLMGIYKLCMRFKQHDAGVVDLARPREAPALAASS